MGVSSEISDQLVFFVNGKKISVKNPDPEWTLVYFLRNKLHHFGTKEACGTGGCGACTVMMSRIDQSGKITNLAVNACLVPLSAVHGTAIVTVEGIGNVNNLHPIQERMAKSHSTQCGFCSPGFVMSTYALLRNNPTPSEKELENAIQGNLCRCTGYRPILESLKTFCGSPNCCKNQKNNQQDSENKKNVKEVPYSSLYDKSSFKSYDPTQDPIFPPELKLTSEKLKTQSLRFQSEFITLFRPNSLQELLELKKSQPEATLIAGGTAPGLRQNINASTKTTLIQISSSVPELFKIEDKPENVVVGAAVTLSQLDEFCKRQPEGKTLGNIFNTYSKWATLVGDLQLRNAGTVGGAIVCENPASDFTTFLVGIGASVTFSSSGGNDERVIINAESIRKSGGISIKPHQVLTSITLPKNQKDEIIWFVKRSNRKYGDTAIINATAKLTFDSANGDNFRTLNFAFGGNLLENVLQINDIANSLTERTLTGDSEKLASTLMGAIQKKLPSTLDNDATSLLSSIVLEFVQDIKQWKMHKNEDNTCSSKSSSCCAKSSQVFEIRPTDENKITIDLVGRPVQHLSAVKNCTGESTFLDDVPYSANELFGHLVLTTEARAKILSIDASEALKIEGVVDFLDYASSGLTPDRNNYGMFVKDEQIFKEGMSESVGEILGILLATDPIIAKKASHFVKVEYDTSDESRKTSPPVFTIEGAIENKSFANPFNIKSGDITKSLEQSEKVIEGEMRSGGQKHFYMETTAARAIPMEDGGVNVSVPAQAITAAQELVAKTLGISANKVLVSCLRIGGGFGGKESGPNHLAAIVALAATKHQRPVRCVIPRSQDSEATGGRHPFLFRYKVGFNSDGQINGIAVDIFSNAGCTNDISIFVMQICVQTLVASYNISSWDIKGTPCLTNLQSNTAFRGFGAPQATFFIENVIERVAELVGKDSDEIRQRHLFKEGEVIAYSGQPMENCTIRRCWSEVIENAKVQERKKAIKEFNQNNKFVKRGLSMSTVTEGAGVPVPFMNQGGALVMIYADGSVQLNHGGIEMGQGLYTKMTQIASRVLGIPVEKIINTATSTDKVPNTIVSAASMTADINGPAVVAACEELNRRLEPIKAANPNGTWEQWIGAAFFSRVNLSAVGFYKLDFPYSCNYYSYGVACTEVEINCLTGEQTVLRTDIVMDVGESLNPAIDIGQIEGGYIMGMGLFILEETKFSKSGQLVSNIPLNYKVPTVASVPREFNVSLLRGAPNPKAVFSSKCIGEPPLVLAVSSYLAIQNAVKAFLQENNQSTDFSIESPLTADKIRRICGGRC